MDKDFKKWLKQDELFEYYNSNPEQQADIYKDYQREKECIKRENIDKWIEWLCNNPELAERHYPLLVNSLKERIQNTPPFITANIIQSFPKHFTTWKAEINSHSGKYREKKIKEQITLLNSVLYEYKYPTEIEQEAVESLRPYLTEQLEYWKGELRLKVKNLFQFIEYLHSNIEKFNQYDGLIEDLEKLHKERNKLKPQQNYKDKQQHDKIQTELETKFKVLQDNTANLIKAKAKELNVCIFDNEPNYSFNGIEAEIQQIKKSFSNEDISEIFKHKRQYLEYRNQTHKTFLSLEFFFNELDEITKSLFDYFKDSEQNEYEAFETKAIQVNSIEEAAKQLQKGSKKVVIKDISISKSGATFRNMPVVENHYLPLFEGMKKHLLENSELSKENKINHWNEIRLQIETDLYSTGKMYNDETVEYCTKRLFPAIDLEIKKIEKTLPPQQTEKRKPELNKALISFSSTEIIESLHNELKGYFQGKEAELKKALQGEQLQEFLLFPHNQNKFVEVFKRLKYNGFLLSKPKETKHWICSTFTYQYQKGNKKEVREFNTSTVHDILTKDKGEPTKKERICIVDWLPYKSHLTRQSEAEKESI